jgi:NSS family neurotransmitter:Na+ symporter
MITYGSYMKKDANVKSSSIQIAGFDSAFALIASLIIIPAVFAFGGGEEGLKNSGPSLMFVQLTNVFNALPGGKIIGTLFFVLVFFAAVTSSVSLVETIVAALCENGKIKRVTACIIVFSIILVLGTLSSLSNGVLADFKIGGLAILDAFDFLANNIMIPVVAIVTCIFAGWFIDKTIIPKEICIDKTPWFNKYFNVIIKYVAPICILIILVTGLFIKL